MTAPHIIDPAHSSVYSARTAHHCESPYLGLALPLLRRNDPHR